jgi:hypothetical protein
MTTPIKPTPTKPRQRRNGPKSSGETLTVWDTLSTTARPHLSDNPQAAADQTSFETAIADIKEANALQDSLTAQLRDSIKSRQEKTRQARVLRNRLVAHLQSKFGPDNEMLRQFGLRPKGLIGRRKPAQPVPETVPATGGSVPEVKTP